MSATSTVRHVPSSLLLACVSVLTACGDRGTSGERVIDAGVTQVVVTPNDATMQVGDTRALSVDVRALNQAAIGDQSVTWSSSVSTVASVDANGNVTAISPGRATITATVEGRRGISEITVVGTAPSATITVNPSRQFQTMTGWEALAGTGYGECDKRAHEAYLPELLTRAAEELKINRLRIPLRGGYEQSYDSFLSFQRGELTFEEWKRIMFNPKNDNDDPFVINPAGFQWAHLDLGIEQVVLPLKRRLQALGDDLWLTLGYTGAREGQNLYRDSAEEYAELALAAFQHMKEKYGVVPSALDIVNEPNLGVWNAQQVATHLVAVKRRLNDAGFFPVFIAPTASSALGTVQFLDQMMQVPGTSQALSMISYHRYGVTHVSHLQAVAQRGAKYRLPTAMVEHIGSGYEDLHDDLTIASVSAWEQFGLAFCDEKEEGRGGLYFVIRGAQPGQNTPRIITTKMSTYLRQYFRYVRLGAVRVAATSSNSAFSPVAFRNTDGRFTVVVKANSGSFSVSGLPPGRYGIEYTTAAEYARSLRDVRITSTQAVTATIPATGALTIYAR